MKILRIPLLVLAYFSIATFLAEAGLLGALAMKGALRRERLFQLMAVAYEVDLYAMWKKMEAAVRPIKRDQVSHEEVIHNRRQLALDLDLQEIATEKGLHDIRQLQAMLEKERKSYQQVRDDFERQLEQARQGALDQALQDVQRQLQAVQAKLAKDQIIRILDDETVDPDTSLQFVVTIVKAMPLEKRKKILAEFKNEDQERLHEILRQIRLGVPDVQLIRTTRNQLEQFKTRQENSNR